MAPLTASWSWLARELTMFVYVKSKPMTQTFSTGPWRLTGLTGQEHLLFSSRTEKEVLPQWPLAFPWERLECSIPQARHMPPGKTQGKVERLIGQVKSITRKIVVQMGIWGGRKT